MRNIVTMLAFSGVFALATLPVLADGEAPTDVYFLSMRSPDVDSSARYASLSLEASDEQSEPFSACDGVTYYLTQDDKAAVNAALANSNTVQLQMGPSGTAAQDSAVVCLVQASP